MTLQARKFAIIQKLELVQEKWLIKSIEKLLSDVRIEKDNLDDLKFERNDTKLEFYVGNIEEKVDLEKIKKERPLKSFDATEFEGLVNDLKWEQSLAELLNDLKE